VGDDDDLPDRVARARGASEASYPWDQAAELVTTLRDMADRLAANFEDRTKARDDLLDWDGPYRVEFDETAQRLEWRAVGTGGLTESLRLAASRVVDGADEANRDQRRRNDFAEDLREEDRERREESWQREGRLPPGEPY
jgi:hypothetical protein